MAAFDLIPDDEEERRRREEELAAESAVPALPGWQILSGENPIATPEPRSVLPEQAPEDFAVDYYKDLATQQDREGSGELADFADQRAQSYAEQVPEAQRTQRPNAAGPSPMWAAFANHQPMGSDVASMGTSSDAGSGGGGGMDGAGWGALAAIGLDLIGNRGRGLGGIAAGIAQNADPYEQQKRALELEHTQAQINALNRGHYYGAQDPESIRLREEALRLRAQAQQNAAAREARLTEAERLKHDPQAAENLRQLYVKAGGDPDMVANMTTEEMVQGRPALMMMLKQAPQNVAAQTSAAAQKAAATSAARLPYDKKRIEYSASLRDNGAEGTAPQIDWASDESALGEHFGGEIPTAWRQRFEALKVEPDKTVASKREQFWKDVQSESTKPNQPKSAATADAMARSYEDANHTKNFMFKVDVPEQYANTEDRGTKRQKLIDTQTVRRALGASSRFSEIDKEYGAMSVADRLSEKGRALATEYENLRKEHQGVIAKIAARGAGAESERAEEMAQIPGLNIVGVPGSHNPLASAKIAGIHGMLRTNGTEMLGGYGISIIEPGEDGWTDPPVRRGSAQQRGGQGSPAPVASAGTSAPAPKSAPVASGDGKSIGTRNGKPVRAVKRGTAPNGERVRVIFYVDGTREVVNG